ncbi:hypothetical protein KC365_g13403 [Hortaea werneckii]|nr:hypothetical protein KC323_g8058 [Hortaea werneckii]KAI7215987.1 hypothetical protein KC365_g13403 [Hortaea werneckii]
MPEQKSLNRALPKLEKEFEQCLMGEGASKTGRENEDELTVARREWAEFRADRAQRDEGISRNAKHKKNERAESSAAHKDMLKRRELKRARLVDEEVDSDEPSNHDNSPVDLTSAEDEGSSY